MAKSEEEFLADYDAKMSRVDMALEAESDQRNSDFEAWCIDNDIDPDDDDAMYLYEDAIAYAEDPYKYNGLRKSDFL